jgi:hypothetical protein
MPANNRVTATGALRTTLFLSLACNPAVVSSALALASASTALAAVPAGTSSEGDVFFNGYTKPQSGEILNGAKLRRRSSINLINAIFDNNKELGKVSLQNGAILDGLALNVAVAKGNKDIVNLLLENYPDELINDKNIKGNTVLLSAAKNFVANPDKDREEILLALITKGAKLDIKNNAG